MNKRQLCWPIAHAYEKEGHPQSALNEILKLAQTMPDFPHLFALDVDRLLRPHLIDGNPITYSANGLSPSSVKKSCNVSIATAFTQTKNLSLAPNTILNAFNLDSEKSSSYALTYAFESAQDKEIDALNILYANQSNKNEKLWLYFLNKYLSQFELNHINLLKSDKQRFFRLTAEKQRNIEAGPLVSILMPAHNAEKTLGHACASILNQTWHPLELILVEDASTDQTWSICQQIAKGDSRVKLHRNSINAGAYVSKNIALQLATGEYITCHDADDWAFPDRIEYQISLLLQDTKKYKATSGTMLRITADGNFVRPSPIGSISDDGILRRCFVSVLFETKFFRQKIGAWDSVHVGADAELIARLEVLAPKSLIHDRRPVMLCLDHPENLTKTFRTGITDSNESYSARAAYKLAWKDWHKTDDKKLSISFPILKRPFEAPSDISVEEDVLKELLVNFDTDYREGLIWAGKAIRGYKDITLTEKSCKKFRPIFLNKSWPRNNPELFQIAHAVSDIYWQEGNFSGSLLLLDQALEAVPEDYFLLQKGINRRLQIARSEMDQNIIQKGSLMMAEKCHEKRLQTNASFAHIVAESWAILNETERAKNHLFNWLDSNPQLFFAMANCNSENDIDWLKSVNSYFAKINATSIILRNGNAPRFFRLNSESSHENYITHGPLISVIMTSYNVADYIEIAIESVLKQTWKNFELIVVDDVSSDNTVSLIRAMMLKDKRIRLIRNEQNSGTYVGRNKAYDSALGEFVTCHDSDDWAHPEKLERQITPLLKDRAKIASFSHMTRIMTQDGIFQFRSAGKYGRHNASSIMFSKSRVKPIVGYWDSVRIGADSEFIARLELAFGFENMVTLPEILMLCAHRPMSLSRDADVGININGLSGPRGEYRTAYRNWHESKSHDHHFVDFPLNNRHFPVPNIILPTRVS